MRWIAPTIDDTTELRRDFSPGFWLPAMQIIAERHGLCAADLELFDSGSDIVFGAGDMVLKLTSPRWRSQMSEEIGWLRWLDGRVGFDVPRVVASGELDGWPYQISTRVGGQAIARIWSALERGQRVELARGIGRVMRQLHQVALPPVDHGWRQFMSERRSGVVAHHRGRGAEESWLDELEALIDRVERPERPLVILHTELLDQHIFVNNVNGAWRVSGLIDLADARAGHPDYELAALSEFLFRGEAGLLGACLDAYGWPAADLTSDHSERLLSWALLHRFASLPRALNAAGEPTPSTLEELADKLYNPSL